ncbi:glutamate receptor 2.9-like [Trifolium pratense]|uniref:glutamate receptor 2.9-like n=1 Tax=Trifolium pratense TaxID=57577 RepID=UPI001E696F77|nr:glutamate receptor 2.9-like [Trifolium pratense]
MVKHNGSIETEILNTIYSKSKTWKFLDAFTKDMWLLIAAIHIFVGFVIWLFEREDNRDLRGIGSMLWFLVNVLFYAHREPTQGTFSN